MKLLKFTLFFFCIAGLFACRKTQNDPDIKQYDEDQIKAYIAANGLTGMKRDAGDTTGIYYQILSQGTGGTIDYPDQLSLVFSISTFDGKFAAKDTIVNHRYDYVGHLSTSLNKGVMLAVINMLKTQGTRARVLVPSHLGYGSSGFGFGSSTSNNRIAGNQCLDYYLNLVSVDRQNSASGRNEQAKYDSVAIKKYMTANNLTSYLPLVVKSEGRNYTMYYKITQAASGGAAIGPTSVVEIQYTSILLNGNLGTDNYNSSDNTGISIDLDADSRAGIVAGLQKAKAGEKLSLIMPSQLVYGRNAFSSDIQANSCLRYDINVLSVVQ